MADKPTLDEVTGLLADLRSISDRIMAGEDIPADETDAFDARKRELIERIQPGFYGEET